MLGEILDDLLISASTGPMHHRLPTFPRACRRAGAVSGVARSAHRRGPARPRHRAALLSSGPRVGARRAGQERGGGHADRVRQDALLQPAGAAVAGRAAGGAHPLPVPDQGAGPGSAAELEKLAKSMPEMRMFTYDGDTPQDARRAVRARANLVLTNPDMLHSGILPHHTKWASLFQNLRFVVIDELHAYRGVFGSHLANVLRRLKRICRPLRLRAAVHHGLGDDRQPARAGAAAHRRAGGGDRRERRAHRREDVSLLQPAGGQPRARHPRAVSRRGGEARDRASCATRSRRSSSPRAGCRPRCC